jgi:cytochrome P450
MDGRWNKYEWTYDAFGAPRSTVFTTNHDAHKARRHAIAPLFSKAKIAARQQVLDRHVDKLCKRISGLTGTSFNLGAAISAFARNISNEFVTGKEYNDLDSEDFNVALSIASQGAGSFWRTTKVIRWFGPALRAMPVDWVAKMADDGTRSFLRYLQVSQAPLSLTLISIAIRERLTVAAMRARHARQPGRRDVSVS